MRDSPSVPEAADKDAEAGLLEDVDVVVVGVAHGPAAGVAPRLVHIGGEDVAAVAVRPFGPPLQATRDLAQGDNRVIGGRRGQVKYMWSWKTGHG